MFYLRSPLKNSEMSAIAAGLRSLLPEPTQQPFQEDTSDRKSGHSTVIFN